MGGSAPGTEWDGKQGEEGCRMEDGVRSGSFEDLCRFSRHYAICN